MDYDVLVVGGGPTAIAALVEARKLGLRAVAVEAQESTFATLRAFAPGLLVASPPHHWEIDGLPLDCRHGSEVTREELLSYYARVITSYALELRTGLRCTGVARDREWLNVHLSSSSSTSSPAQYVELRARAVVWSAWFRTRSAPPQLIDSSGRTLTVSGGCDATAYAGRRCTVVGAGLSAAERACALMRLGLRIHWVSRTALDAWQRHPQVEPLLRSTNSEVVSGASSVSVMEGRFEAQVEGRGRAWPCEVVIACLGQELDPEAARIASSLGLIETESLLCLEQVRTFEAELRRRGSMQGLRGTVESTLEAWPDLRRALLEGAQGVRAVGGILHPGGPHAGVLISMETARLALRALAGEHVDLGPGRLPSVLHAWAETLPPAAPPPFSQVASLRPLRVCSYARTTPVHVPELSSGVRSEAPLLPVARSHVLGKLGESRLAEVLMRAANGERSLAQLAVAMGASTAEERENLARSFFWLCRCNGLTWLPASDGANAESA